MSDHSLAFVPLGSGYHQSTDLFARGRPVDTGLLAEALIYYDRVLINVDNPLQFSQLISWLVQQGLSAGDITALFREGIFQVYDFAFTTNPFVDFQGDNVQVHGLYNIQDPTMEKPNTFVQRFLEFEPLRECFVSSSQFEHFAKALEGRVVEVKAEEIGATAIDNAYHDFLNPERSALMAQELVNEIYRIKFLGKPPKVQVEVRDLGQGDFKVNWNIPLNRLPALEGQTNIAAAVTIPLTTAAQANKYLWAADKQRCDLYLARPMSVLVGNKLFEASETVFKSQLKARNVIEELEVRVEFPDLRKYVNQDKIDFKRVLEIRQRSKKFRQWLQSEADRDRDAIIAYHHEVAEASGFAKVTRRGLRIFGVLGGAAVGATVADHAAIGATLGAAAGALLEDGVKESMKYLFDLGANLGDKWKPVVFGNWYSRKISKLLEKDRQ
ncbi:MAG: hypothetical protein JWM21_870 [Acidobacteria bacterium]|nr:hypothetical protein [Acidobacteriota bacterium]